MMTAAQVGTETEFIIGLLMKLLGRGDCKEYPGDPRDDHVNQNAPGINVINNSRMTTAWARKAWLEENKKRMRRRGHHRGVSHLRSMFER